MLKHHLDGHLQSQFSHRPKDSPVAHHKSRQYHTIRKNIPACFDKEARKPDKTRKTQKAQEDENVLYFCGMYS